MNDSPRDDPALTFADSRSIKIIQLKSQIAQLRRSEQSLRNLLDTHAARNRGSERSEIAAGLEEKLREIEKLNELLNEVELEP